MVYKTFWFGYFALKWLVFRIGIVDFGSLCLGWTEQNLAKWGNHPQKHKCRTYNEFITCFHEFCNYKSLIFTTLFLFIYFFLHGKVYLVIMVIYGIFCQNWNFYNEKKNIENTKKVNKLNFRYKNSRFSLVVCMR